MDISTFFASPSIWGIGLAIVFGAIWVVPLLPVNWRRATAWLMLVGGVVLFLISLNWIQVPFQQAVASRLIERFGMQTYQEQLLLMAIPLVLISGLVQEGAKLFLVAIYWGQRGRQIEPKLGLSLGVMAGAGFGIFETQWILNSIFAMGWNWSLVQSGGIIALAGFWERFFTVGFHISVTALACWGLAKGRGWQFYLLASFLHFLVNYMAVLYQTGGLDIPPLEIILAVITLVLFSIVLRLRWRKEVEPSPPGEDTGTQV